MQEVQSQIALVPYGGYGRREMAPYSDIDLMLLHTQDHCPGDSAGAATRPRLLRHRHRLGFSVRTAGQACQMTTRDPVIFTRLVDARFLGGSVRLFRNSSTHLHDSRRAAPLVTS